MSFFSKNPIGKEQAAIIVDAIRQAEKNTSGEVRVHAEFHCKSDVVKRAVEVFEKLEMHKTEARNGVLIYVAVSDHVFAIIGDEGINNKVPENFWNEVKDEMASRFRSNQLIEGITYGVLQAGEKLKAYFPYQSDDKNELSDEVSFG
jgi:uncharacterized membrane protein